MLARVSLPAVAGLHHSLVTLRTPVPGSVTDGHLARPPCTATTCVASATLHGNDLLPCIGRLRWGCSRKSSSRNSKGTRTKACARACTASRKSPR